MLNFFQGPKVAILIYSGSIFPRNSQQTSYLGGHVPDGLVARIRRSQRRGPGSIPGQGKLQTLFLVCPRFLELRGHCGSLCALGAMRYAQGVIPRVRSVL